MDPQTWNAALLSLPNPTLLQTYQWGEAKAPFGWQPFHKLWHDSSGEVEAAALVLKRGLRLGGIGPEACMLYVPKGPILRDWADAGLRARVIADLTELAREHAAFLLKIEPELPVGRGLPGAPGAQEGLIGVSVREELQAGGWRFSNEQIQFRNTVLVDLTPNEDDILMNMKSKTRYNIRLAARKGVTVRRGAAADFDMLFTMYAETAIRDGFTIRARDYYLHVWNTFWDAGLLTPLIAEAEGQPLAGLMLFDFGSTAWYIYGMSRDLHRNLMPTYLIQWEAMRAAKEQGCTVYDMWGAPIVFDESDDLWGVYRFKDGFGGHVLRTVGAWDLPLRPLIYTAYAQILPRLIALMRLRGDAETRQQVDGGL
jgi:lipid II:glycine glycyltransferase (peptidoglycan interpeptide bridge formation enzyme)